MWQWLCGVICEASAFFCERTCRNPPKKSGMTPAPYKIPTLIGRPDLAMKLVEKCVQRFKMERTSRGRKNGWRKTTPRQDAQMVSAFHRARKPLGSLCEARDVWKDCSRSVRDKVDSSSSSPWVDPVCASGECTDDTS